MSEREPPPVWEDEPWQPMERDAPPPQPPPRRQSRPPARHGSALLAGIAAAALGAGAWWFLADRTGYEIGILAWGIGLLCGGAVLAGGRRRGDLGLLAIASLTALGGIVAGKLLADSPFGVEDALWIGLALVSAWYVLRPQAEQHAEHADEHGHPPRAMRGNPVDRLTEGLPHGWRVTIDWVVTIVGAIAIVLAIKAWVVNPYRIPSSSMETTLHCATPAPGCEARFSDRVLANRFVYHFTEPERGDIVVFDTPPEAQVRCGAGGTFVKRLIGLPGDRVEIRLRRGDAYVYVNGRELEEPYIERDRRDTGPERTFTVPANHYFMMGDNRAQSCDSRVWGAVPRENLIGKVFATYWPPNRISFR